MLLQGSSPVPPSIQVLQAAITVVVGAGAAVWAIVKTVRRREHAPRLQFAVDIQFVGVQDGQWLVELLALVDNNGLVRHTIREFTFDLRILYARDHIKEGDQAVNGQTLIPNKIKTGAWVPSAWEGTFIEPGVQTRYSFVSAIPVNATFALLHGRFDYGQNSFHTADKLVAVPARISP